MSDEGAHGVGVAEETLRDQLLREKSLSLKNIEKTVIEVAWQRAHGNVTKACRLLGIGRTTMYRKLKQYDLQT